MEDNQAADESSYSISPLFQTETDSSVPAVIQMVDVALRSYFLRCARKPQLTTPEEIRAAIRV